MTDNSTKEDQSNQINSENQTKEDANESNTQNDLNDKLNDNKDDQAPKSNDDTNNNDNTNNNDDVDQNATSNDKKEKQKSILDYPETQNVEIERDEQNKEDAFSVPESQPNFDEPHGLTGVLKKKKPRRRVDPIKLEDIPSWTDYAPSIYEGKRLPKKEDLLFPPNDAINKLISYIPRGDSTILAVDAIVNAANSGLYAGGGICGAIHSAAGPELEEACMKIGGCDTGKAVITPGFDLPSKFVIHAVGPIGQHPEELKSAYEKTLEFIDGKDVRSVALCCISTGIYGYPIRPATKIALKTVREFLENEENQKNTDRIIFVVFNQKDCAVYENFLSYYFPLPEGAIKDAKYDDDDDDDNKDAILEEEEEEEEDGSFEIADEESPEVDQNEIGDVNLEANRPDPINNEVKTTDEQETKTLETEDQITDAQVTDDN